MIIMFIETIKKSYGALKVECKYFEDKRYYLYGFKLDEKEWDYDKGELLLVTDELDEIKKVTKHIFTLFTEVVHCRECFRLKNVDNLKKEGQNYWGVHVWDGLPDIAIVTLQNQLLTYFPDFGWSNVRGLKKEKPFIFFNVCVDCMDEEEYNSSKEIASYRSKIKTLSHQLAAELIMKTKKEEDLEKYIADHLDLVEPGMTLIETQKGTGSGYIDILAKDINDKLCVFELKVVDNDQKIVWQAAHYQNAFDEPVRVITIAPNYTPNILKALKNIKNTEIKIYNYDKNGLIQIRDLISKENLLEGKINEIENEVG